MGKRKRKYYLGEAQEAAIQRAVELKRAGLTDDGVAERMGVLPYSVKHWLGKARQRGIDYSARGPAAPEQRTDPAAGGESGPVRFEEYTFTDVSSERPRLPRFDGEPHVWGDCIVAGDFQLPTTDYALAETLLRVAKAQGIRTLLIIGDWVNMDAFSRYDHIIPPPPFAVEVAVSVELMSRYAAWFQEIWLALGNHEHRLLKALKGDWDNSLLGRLLSTAHGVLKVTPYSHIVIHSGRETWRATHQVNYSKIKGRVGDELAQKFQCNVIVHHQHHAAKLMDRYGRYVVIDNGGLFDVAKMSYVMLRDSTSVGMTQGFTIIRDGVGELITPYPAYTNLAAWTGAEGAAARG